MNIFLKAFIGLLFVLLVTAGVAIGMNLIELPGAGLKIAGVLVLALTTGVACVGVYHFIGVNPEDLL